MESQTEVWKDIPDYEKYYQSSNLGAVRSINRMVKHSERMPLIKRSGHTLTLQTHRLGYKRVILQSDGLKKSFYVHQLVMKAFNPNNSHIPLEVNHKNGIKSDNRIENLEWVTHSENVQHCFDMGLKIPDKGESHHNSKITNEQVLEIRKLASGNKEYKRIAKLFLINPSTVRRIAIRQSWKHI